MTGRLRSIRALGPHQARLDRIVSWLCSASATDPVGLKEPPMGSGSPIAEAIGSMVFLMMTLLASADADIDHESDEVI